MSIDATAAFDSIIIFYGLSSVILLYLFTYLEAYNEASKLKQKYRNFMIKFLEAGSIVNLIGIAYFSLRMQQWALGLYNYIFVDFIVAIVINLLYVSTYPYFLDKMKQLEILYG